MFQKTAHCNFCKAPITQKSGKALAHNPNTLGYRDAAIIFQRSFEHATTNDVHVCNVCAVGLLAVMKLITPRGPNNPMEVAPHGTVTGRTPTRKEAKRHAEVLEQNRETFRQEGAGLTDEEREPTNTTSWPKYLNLRDTGLHDDMGGGGQRIFTTAGQGYEKVRYMLDVTGAVDTETMGEQRKRVAREKDRMAEVVERAKPR